MVDETGVEQPDIATEEPQQPPIGKAEKLYNNLVKTGFTEKQLGKKDEFLQAIQNPINANKIYSGLRVAGLTEDNLGTMKEFHDAFSLKKNDGSNGSGTFSATKQSTDDFIKQIKTISDNHKKEVQQLKDDPNAPHYQQLAEQERNQPQGDWKNTLPLMAHSLTQMITKPLAGATKMLRDAIDTNPFIGKNPLYDKDGNLTQYGKDVDSGKKSDILGKLTIGLDAYNNNTEKSDQQNQLPHTILGNTANGIIGLAPDIISTAVFPEEKVGASLLEKIAFNPFNKVLTIKGGLNGYNAAEEHGATPGEAAVEGLKGAAKSEAEATAMNVLSGVGHAVSPKIVKGLEDAGIVKDNVLTQKGSAAVTNAALFGAYPIAKNLIQGKPFNKDEVESGLGMGILFGLTGRSHEKAEETRQSLAIQNFMNASPEAIKAAHEVETPVADINAEAIHNAAQYNETGNPEHAATASTLTKTADVKGTVDAILKDKDGFIESIDKSDLPEETKAQVIAKINETHQQLDPIEQQKTVIGQQIGEVDSHLKELENNKSTDPVEMAKNEVQTEILTKHRDELNNQLKSIITKTYENESSNEKNSQESSQSGEKSGSRSRQGEENAVADEEKVSNSGEVKAEPELTEQQKSFIDDAKETHPDLDVNKVNETAFKIAKEHGRDTFDDTDYSAAVNIETADNSVDKLTPVSRAFYDDALKQYKNAPKDKKSEMVQIVKDQLAKHEQGEKMGFGLEQNKVDAGKEFLKTVDKNNDTTNNITEAGDNGSGIESPASEVQPNETNEPEAPKTTGIKKAISEATRIEKKLPEVKLSKLGKDAETLQKGKEAVDSGKINPAEVAQRTIAEPRAYSAEEAGAMQYYGHQLAEQEANLRTALHEADNEEDKTLIGGNLQELQDQVDAYSAANRINSREWSNLGNIMQIEADQSFSPANIRTIIKENYGGKIPKDVEERIAKAEAERDKAISDLKKATEANIKEQGAKAVERMRKSIKLVKQTKAELEAEAEQLKKELIKAFKTDSARANSGIPLPTETLAVLGKLAVNYFKQGVKDFEGLANKIYDDLKETGIDKNEIREYLSNYDPLRDESRERSLELLGRKERSANKQLETGKIIDRTQKEKIVFKKTDAILTAEQKVHDAEYKLKQEKQKSYKATETGLQRGANWFLRWERRLILANPLTSIKLAAASLSGPIMRLPKELAGGLYGTMFSKLAVNSRIEAGFDAQAEIKYWKEFFNPKTFGKDALTILKTGVSPLKKQFGSKFIEHYPGYDALMDVHSIIKNPLHRATFEASLIKAYAWAEKEGLTYKDPYVKKSLEQAAFDRAEYEIFQQSNTLGKQLSKILDDESKTNNVKRFIFKFLFPINLVPTNITGRVFSSVFGVPRGLYMTMEAYKKGVDNLTSEQTDFIFRQLKNGTVGSAYYAMGFFASRAILGGLWQKDDKDAKKSLPNRLGYNEMKINGTNIDKRIQHGMPLHIMQLGATNKRVYDHYYDIPSDDNKMVHWAKAAGESIGAAAGAEAEESPLLSTPYHLLGAIFDPYEREKFFSEMGNKVGYPIVKPVIENKEQLGKDINEKNIGGIIKDITQSPEHKPLDKKLAEFKNDEGEKVPLTPEQVKQRKSDYDKQLQENKKDWEDNFNDGWTDDKNADKLNKLKKYWKTIGRSDAYIKNKLSDMREDALNTFLEKQALAASTENLNK